MSTSIEVFAKRKAGDIDNAYKMAIDLMKNPNPCEWDIKAFAWCLVDLIKRDSKLEQCDNLKHYARQLIDLKIDALDGILTAQREYALRLCNPNQQDLQNAKDLSKKGNHLEAIKIYRRLLNSGDDSVEIQTSLAWEFYRISKELITQNPPNVTGAKSYLNEYFHLKTEKPSLLHTCILQQADMLAKDGKLHMGAFARIWDLKNLRAEDYERFQTDDGKVYPSLAEKVIQHASKDAFSRDAQKDLLYILPFITDCIKRYPDNLWLKLSKAKTLMAIGQNKEALSFGLEVVKNKSNDYWAWELLGDIHHSTAPEIALSCYCKALLCSKDINFLGKVKVKLAELLVKNQDYPHAKLEIEEIVKYRTENDQKISEVAEFIQKQPWYENETAATSNQELYRKNAPMAEELLYSDLPWLKGVLGEVFTIDSKPDKPRRKLYIQSTPVPMEISIPESKVSRSGNCVGMGIKIKGEYDSENRFQVYTWAVRGADTDWDIFERLIGVVDHVNHQKNLIHFLVSRELDGIIRFSDLSDKFEEGDAIALHISQYTSNQGTRYRTLTSSRTTESIPESLVKSFEENVRQENGMGFTEYGIFIPPPLVEMHNIQNDDYVSGKAILNYNKKRSEWSWRAISIDEVQ